MTMRNCHLQCYRHWFTQEIWCPVEQGWIEECPKERGAYERNSGGGFALDSRGGGGFALDSRGGLGQTALPPRQLGGGGLGQTALPRVSVSRVAVTAERGNGGRAVCPKPPRGNGAKGRRE